MDRIARGSEADRKELFTRTAGSMGQLQPAIIEKDFWVCWTLDVLFSSEHWRDKMIFKGGTSLSKAFHLIDRFSEDIDLILDWRQLGVTDNMSWEERSNTSQDKFCKDINSKAALYLANKFVPSFSRELEKRLGCRLLVTADNLIVTVTYPKSFSLESIRPEIVLEIGPLGDWVPHAPYEIMSYAAEKFPDLFTRKSVRVMTIEAKRTFWEKATILHQQAMAGKLSNRYSRHYYDLAILAQSEVRVAALADMDLLKAVVAFKRRFYRSLKACYELAAPGTLRLIPSNEQIAALKQDYEKMKPMLFGRPPSFESIIEALKSLEGEINQI